MSGFWIPLIAIFLFLSYQLCVALIEVLHRQRTQMIFLGEGIHSWEAWGEAERIKCHLTRCHVTSMKEWQQWGLSKKWRICFWVENLPRNSRPIVETIKHGTVKNDPSWEKSNHCGISRLVEISLRTFGKLVSFYCSDHLSGIEEPIIKILVSTFSHKSFFG